VNTKNLYDTKNRPDSTQNKAGGSPTKYREDWKNKAQKPKGSWSWFFFKILMFLGLCGGGYVGYTAWRTQQKRSHRF